MFKSLLPVLFIYNLFMLTAIGLLCPIWIPLVCLRKKYRGTFLNRLFMQPVAGKENACKGTGPPGRIWIHALSVGEVLSAEPLVKALSKKHGAEKLIFSASTHTGFETARRVIAPHVKAVRHFPYDTIFSVKRAVKVIRPRQVVIVETDIWPNFLYRMDRLGIPVCLVNARLSERSFRGYKRFDFVMAPLLKAFRCVCAQTDRDRRRFINLGVSGNAVVAVGNMKFDQAPANISVSDRQQLSATLNLPAGSPCWVAGSTHQGEEEILCDAYRMLFASGIEAALIVAPRDPGRAVDVCGVFNRRGIQAMTLAQMERHHRPSKVVVIDRIGILRRLYALADVTFVGGSLVKAGGHNPLEPASLAKPVLFGPHTDDFHWICRTLEIKGGALRVFDANRMVDIVRELILNEEKNIRVGQAAYTVFRNHRGAVARTMAMIE